MERFRDSPLFPHRLQFLVSLRGYGPGVGGGWGERILKAPLKNIVIPGYGAGGDTVSIMMGTSLFN